MKKIFLIAAAAALLTSTLVAQEVEGKAKIGQSEGKARLDVNGQTQVQADIDRQPTVSDNSNDRAMNMRRSTVDNRHKATKLLGMEVKNDRGQLLGDIQDLVVDLDSGRISYVVLAAGGFLGIREKYIAIPPSALSAAVDDENKLVLHVDKSVIDRAQGFVKNSWPDWQNPSWGAAFAPENFEHGATSEHTDHADHHAQIESKTEFNDSGKSGAYRDHYDRTHQERGGHLEQSTSLRDEHDGMFRGRITAINPETRTMTVAGDSGTETFSITDKPVIAIKENRNPSLSDLKVGYPVVVEFGHEGDANVVHKILRTDTPEVK